MGRGVYSYPQAGPGRNADQAASRMRASKHGKTNALFCQGHGRPLPVITALDPIPVALGCAVKCMTPEDWMAVCDSALNKDGWTIPDLQAEMCAVPQRLRAAGFTVHVQPKIPDVGWVDLRIGRLLIECDRRRRSAAELDQINSVTTPAWRTIEMIGAGIETHCWAGG